MAEEKAETPAPKAKSKLLLFIIIGVLVLVLAGGGIAFMLMKKKPAEDAEGEDGETVAEAKHDSKKGGHNLPPVYVKLDTFTTNLAQDENTTAQAAQYIQAVIELKVGEAPEGETIKQYMPEIRNGILRLLSNKKPSQLTTTEGKDALAEEIRGTVNEIVNPSPKKKGKAPAAAPAEGPVTAVLFSSFIIQ